MQAGMDCPANAEYLDGFSAKDFEGAATRRDTIGAAGFGHQFTQHRTQAKHDAE